MHRERRLLSLGERLQVCLGTFLGRLSFLLGAAVLLALGNQECPGVQLEVRGEVCTGERQMVPTTMRWLCLNHGGAAWILLFRPVLEFPRTDVVCLLGWHPWERRWGHFQGLKWQSMQIPARPPRANWGPRKRKRLSRTSLSLEVGRM